MSNMYIYSGYRSLPMCLTNHYKSHTSAHHVSPHCSAMRSPGVSTAAAPSLDYVARMRLAQADPTICPLLLLAPMESLGDWRFRKSLADTAGGFDEACTGRSGQYSDAYRYTDYPPHIHFLSGLIDTYWDKAARDDFSQSGVHFTPCLPRLSLAFILPAYPAYFSPTLLL